MMEELNVLLGPVARNSEEMAHNLCLLGGGDMGKGIRNLWLHGFGSGSIIATTAIGGTVLLYHVAVGRKRKCKVPVTTKLILNAGYEAGKRQQRELDECRNRVLYRDID